MADITVTPAQVLPSANAQIRTGTAGTTIVAGQTVYVDTADANKLKLAYNAGTALQGAVAGLALNGGAAGQVIRYVTEDPALVLGTAAAATPLTVGDVLFLGGVAGGITKTTADLDTGEFVGFLGLVTIAVSATVNFKIVTTGAARTTDQI